MVEALRRDFPEAAIEIPSGGYYVWLTLPPEVDGDELAQRAKQAGVAIIPGSKFFAGEAKRHPRNEGAPRNHVRLAFSHAAPDEIDEGVKRLAAAYATVRASPRRG
jgi:2-aminoadipate transaminase